MENIFEQYRTNIRTGKTVALIEKFVSLNNLHIPKSYFYPNIAYIVYNEN